MLKKILEKIKITVESGRLIALNILILLPSKTIKIPALPTLFLPELIKCYIIYEAYLGIIQNYENKRLQLWMSTKQSFQLLGNE